jgi:hypothetical protein
MVRHDALAFRTTLMLADGGLTLGLEEALPTVNATLPGPEV